MVATLSHKIKTLCELHISVALCCQTDELEQTDWLSLLGLERRQLLLPGTYRPSRAVIKDVGNASLSVNLLLPVSLHSTTSHISLSPSSSGNPSLASPSSKLAQNAPYRWFLIATPCAVFPSNEHNCFLYLWLIFWRTSVSPLNCELQESKGCTLDSQLWIPYS